MTVGSLFSGIGGLELGLERVGFDIRWQVEIDKDCTKLLEARWLSVKRYGDIRQLTGAELEPVDLICGGFPCQDLSQAGKRAGIKGARSGLWFEFARLVGELRPRYVLAENVPGLLVPGAMSRVVGELARLGYVGLWRCLRASDFGASHIRKRVFIVAYNAQLIGRGEQIGLRGSALPTGVSAADADVAHRPPGGRGELREPSGSGGQPDRGCEVVEYSTGDHGRRRNGREEAGVGPNGIGRRGSTSSDATVADPGDGQLQEPRRGSQGRDGAGPAGADVLRSAPLPFAPGPSDPRWPGIIRARPDLAPAIESPLRGVADGIPRDLDRAMSARTKRLKALGNAVVPDCSEWIGRQILAFSEREERASGKETVGCVPAGNDPST